MHLGATSGATASPQQQQQHKPQGKSYFARLPDKHKRIIGFAMSLVSGLLYGVNFTPAQYLIDTKVRRWLFCMSISALCGVLPYLIATKVIITRVRVCVFLQARVKSA